MDKRKPMSEETKRKISHSTKGRVGYWTGKKRDKETKEKIGLSHMGRVHSEESKAKMSSSHMGSKNPRAKEVVMMNLEGLELASFGSISDAARTVGTTPGIVRYACIKEGRVVNGYLWKFK